MGHSVMPGLPPMEVWPIPPRDPNQMKNMAIINVKKQTEQQAPVINAVCVDVVDLGTVETPWGRKPQVKFVFESDQLNLYGEQRLLIRTFNKNTYEKSALSIALKSWCGRDLAQEESNGTLDLNRQVGQQATLEIKATISKGGTPYDKIVGILPPGVVEVQASGRYQREE